MSAAHVAARALIALAAMAALVAGSAGASPAPSATAEANPPCFGAASRDPVNPCDNPDLATTVMPTPAEAELTPNAPCRLTNAAIDLCVFGAERGATQVALVGDSHAEHWRAAFAVVARSMHWKGLSITRPSCPFTAAPTVLPEPLRSQCSAWVRAVEHWFARHPGVHTVFFASHRARVAAAPGEDVGTAQIRGFARAWRHLPPSVSHIVVLRDTPYMRSDTLACVQAAIESNAPAGANCAVPRSFALRYDAAAAAARLRRLPVIDMTQSFCDAQLCYPVIGGALAYRDSAHLTRAFATTLGPLLARELAALMGSWSS